MATNAYVRPSGDPEAMRAAVRSRFAIEIAIDSELRACAARVLGLNAGADRDLFLKRCGLAFDEVEKKLSKLTLRGPK